jgi:MFS family permease
LQGGVGRRRATLLALYVAGAAFTLQQLLVLPALPHLVRDLHTTQEWAVWVVTGFMLSSVVVTPLLGKLGDQHGKDRVLLIAMGVFFAGCVGAFFAWSIWSLIAFRTIQGTGAAILPLSYSIIRDEVPAERVGTTIGTMAAVAGVGGVLAFVIGGPIIDTLGWRFLFATGALGSPSPRSSCTCSSRSRRSGRRPGSTCPARRCSHSVSPRSSSV